jgi:dTDP-4-dehydrorhamnose 3,5-epimerase
MSRIHGKLHTSIFDISLFTLRRLVMIVNNGCPERKDRDFFVEGSIEGVVFKPVLIHADNRGWLAELYRHDELSTEIHPVMAYISETLPGTARGPHEHTAQTDYFAFIGPGEFVLYLWDARTGSPTKGNKIRVMAGESNKQIVVIPPGIVHAYKNISNRPGWVFNGPNRLYAGADRKEVVDEIRYEDIQYSPYTLD